MNETCVVVVDEAQNLSRELLEEIRLLTNLESSSEKLLQIVLSGQPELDEKLRHPSVRQLRQRIFLWCRTQPLTSDQTLEYIIERLRIAGATAQSSRPRPHALVHQHSRGIPRSSISSASTRSSSATSSRPLRSPARPSPPSPQIWSWRCNPF